MKFRAGFRDYAEDFDPKVNHFKKLHTPSNIINVINQTTGKDGITCADVIDDDDGGDEEKNNKDQGDRLLDPPNVMVVPSQDVVNGTTCIKTDAVAEDTGV